MTPFKIRQRLKKLLFREKSAPAPAPAIPRYTVSFVLPDGTRYETSAKAGDSLVLASGRGPRPIATGCADGTCGTCRVEVLSGADRLTPQEDHEERTKQKNGVEPHLRLGCQAGVLGEGVSVRIINVFGEEPADGE